MEIYKSFILSKLEHGAFLYIDTKQFALKMIDYPQHGLKTCHKCIPF